MWELEIFKNEFCIGYDDELLIIKYNSDTIK